MVTIEQAAVHSEFHAEGCSRTVGPRGGITERIERWRVSGALKLWKTRPEMFRLPIKHGMRTSWQIDESNAYRFHTPAACPLTGNTPEQIAADDAAHAAEVERYRILPCPDCDRQWTGADGLNAHRVFAHDVAIDLSDGAREIIAMYQNRTAEVSA